MVDLSFCYRTLLLEDRKIFLHRHNAENATHTQKEYSSPPRCRGTPYPRGCPSPLRQSLKASFPGSAWERENDVFL